MYMYVCTYLHTEAKKRGIKCGVRGTSGGSSCQKPESFLLVMFRKPWDWSFRNRVKNTVLTVNQCRNPVQLKWPGDSYWLILVVKRQLLRKWEEFNLRGNQWCVVCATHWLAHVYLFPRPKSDSAFRIRLDICPSLFSSLFDFYNSQ